ncbi:MAG: hypothetical protein OQK07_05605 [Rhodospirillales bacterium]|nr:hypothetical protein [Rhodospirillales bacterium]
MAGLETAAIISLIGTGISAIGGMQQSAAASRNARRQADAERQRALMAQDIEDRRRRERARQLIAAQRARFGASGTGAGGSGAAVLAGLSTRTEGEIAEERGLLGLRLSDARSRNLLAERDARTRDILSLTQRAGRMASLLAP